VIIPVPDANMCATWMGLKSDGSGSKGLTPYTCLCYRCCALEQGTPSVYTLNTLYWTFFHSPGLLSNLRLPWKREFALKFFTVLNLLFTFSALNLY